MLFSLRQYLFLRFEQKLTYIMFTKRFSSAAAIDPGYLHVAAVFVQARVEKRNLILKPPARMRLNKD